MSEANKRLLFPWFCELLRLTGWPLGFSYGTSGKIPPSRSLQESFLGTKDCWPVSDTVSRPLLPTCLLHVVSEGELADGTGLLTDTQGCFARLSRELAWPSVLCCLLLAQTLREKIKLYLFVTEWQCPVPLYLLQRPESVSS